jgi:hypothetical protein
MENIKKSFSVSNYGDLDLWSYFPTPEEALQAGQELEAKQQASWEAYYASEESMMKSVETTESEGNKDSKNFCKSLNVEKQYFTAVVLRPEDVDAHGDIYSHEAVEEAAESYMLKSQQGNVQHLFNTDQMSVVESYIAKSEALEGGILKGDWVMTMKVHDEELWKMCKDGLFTGFSVGCKGTVEDVEGET